MFVMAIGSNQTCRSRTSYCFEMGLRGSSDGHLPSSFVAVAVAVVGEELLDPNQTFAAN